MRDRESESPTMGSRAYMVHDENGGKEAMNLYASTQYSSRSGSSNPSTTAFHFHRPSRNPFAVSSKTISLRFCTYTCETFIGGLASVSDGGRELELGLTVLSVTFCLSCGIVSGSMGDSNSSDKSSTAFSRSL